MAIKRFEAVRKFLAPVKKFLASSQHLVQWDGDAEIEELVISEESKFIGFRSGNCIYEVYSPESDCGELLASIKDEIKGKLFVLEKVEWAK